MRTFGRFFLLVAVPLATGGGAYVIAYHVVENRPRVVAPETVDVGSHVQATTVRVEFAIRNDGRQPLDLWDVRTGCGCLVLAVRTPQGQQILTTATLLPGEELPLVAEWAMAGERVSQFCRNVFVRTNDPDRPELNIPFTGTVHGWLVAYPKEIGLGELAPRQVIRRNIVLRDTGRPVPSSISRVTSSRPDLVRVVAYKPAAGGSDVAFGSLGRQVGDIEVEAVAPDAASQMAADIEVYESGQPRPVLSVPVSGWCTNAYSVHPSVLAFPRGEAGGESFRSTLLVRRADNQPFALTGFDASSGLAVVVVGETGGEKSRWLVQVAWNHRAGATAVGEERHVGLIVERNGVRSTVIVPVHCRHAN